MLSPNAILVFVLSICFTWLMPVFWGWCQTYVSDSAITPDGTVVSGGAVALGKGSLHNNAFMTGDDIGPDSIFNYPKLPDAESLQAPPGLSLACRAVLRKRSPHHSPYSYDIVIR